MAATAGALLAGGCRSTHAPGPDFPPRPENRAGFPRTEDIYSEFQNATAQFKQQTTAAERDRLIQHYVWIEGDDILLPETEDKWDARDYSFYIFAHLPDDQSLGAGLAGRTIEELLKTGALRIETVGVESTLSFPMRGPEIGKPAAGGDKTPSPPANGSAAGESVSSDAAYSGKTAVINGSVAKLTVKFRQNQNFGPFTIIAWFPAMFAAGGNTPPEREKWYARRDVKVFYGDIRTRVQIVGQDEAAGMFGKTFAQNYYVGRVFLRNRNQEKALAVYTTSMRVPVLFYRKTGIAGGLPPTAAAELEREARRKFDATAGTEATPRTAGAILAALQPPAAQDLAEEILRQYPPPAAADESGPQPLRQYTATELAERITVLWQLWAAARPDPTALTSEQRSDLVQRAFDHAASADVPDSTVTECATTIVQPPLDDLGAQAKKVAAAARLFRNAHRRFVLAASAARQEAALQGERLEAIMNNLPPPAVPGPDAGPTPGAQAKPGPAGVTPATAVKGGAPQGQNPAKPAEDRPANDQHAASPDATPTRGAQIKTGLVDLMKAATTEAIDSLAQKLAKLADEEPDQTRHDAYAAAIESARAAAVKQLQMRTLADTIEHKPVDTSQDALLRSWMELRLAALRNQAFSAPTGGTPFDEISAISVNPAGDPLAYSANSARQMQLLENGFMWRASYRPMTFQAVLNSVMFSHENDPTTKLFDRLETLAKIAGGAVGLSSVAHEFGTQTYLQSTNFFSSIFVPSLRALLVEDLRKHITNVGDMAMDTVLVIQPHESVDRYVFFPRGPIYNFPDEFDPVTPAWIAGIEGDDLFVEALPINPNEVVRGGSVEANTLVARALNEGEKTEQARLFDAAQTQSRLRTAALGSLASQIDDLMAAVPKDDKGNPDPAGLARAKAKAQQLAQNFSAYFGPDQSGALAAKLAQYGITIDGSPPVVTTTVAVDLPVGAVTRPIPILISDTTTALKDLKVARKADDDTANSSWLAKATPTVAATGVTITLDSKPDSSSTPLKEATAHKTDFTVTNDAGFTTPFSVPVTLRPWDPQFTLEDALTGIQNAITANNDSGTASAADTSHVLKRQLYRLHISVSAGDADVSKLTIDLKSPPTDGTATFAGSTTSSGTPAAIARVLTVDASVPADPKDATTKATLDLTVVVKRDTNVLASRAFRFWVERKAQQ